MRTFAELAAEPVPPLDELALALAAEFRTVDAEAATARLDALGAELRDALDPDADPASQARMCAVVLGGAHGYTGNREAYDHPDNSMLDIVLETKRGLPILLSTIYVEVARRADVPLAGVGLPGHFVVGHFGTDPVVLLDPFDGGFAVDVEVDEAYVEPWAAADIAMRMLNNLVGSFARRGDASSAVHAAGMRLALTSDEAQRDALERELQVLRARLQQP